MIDRLTFPTASRERAQVRLVEAINAAGGRYPRRIVLGAADCAMLRRQMDARHGYRRKPLDILNIPVVEGEIERGVIGFEWE